MPHKFDIDAEIKTALGAGFIEQPPSGFSAAVMQQIMAAPAVKRKDAPLIPAQTVLALSAGFVLVMAAYLLLNRHHLNFASPAIVTRITEALRLPRFNPAFQLSPQLSMIITSALSLVIVQLVLIRKMCLK